MAIIDKKGLISDGTEQAIDGLISSLDKLVLSMEDVITTGQKLEKQAKDEVKTRKGSEKLSDEVIKNNDKLVKTTVKLTNLQTNYTKSLVSLNKQKEKSAKQSKKIADANDHESNSIKALRDENKKLITQRNKLNTSTAKGVAAIKKLNDAIDINNKKITENSSGLEKQKDNVGNYNSSITALIPGFDRINSSLDSMGVSMAGMGKSSGGMKKMFGSLVSGLKAATRQATAFIATPIGAAIAALAAIGIATKAFFDFNTEIRKVNKELGALTNESGPLLDNIRVRAQSIAEVFNTEVNESVKAASKLVRTMGISYDEAFDIIQTGLTRGANANGDYLDSLGEYGVQFKKAGYSAEEFNNILIEGADAGIYMDKLPDAIKEAGLALSEQTKASGDAITNAFGEEFKNKLFDGIKDGSITTKDALTIMGNEANRIGLTVQQSAQLTADVFKGAGEDAGGAIVIFDVLGKSVENVNKPLNELQQNQKDLADSTLELNQAYDDAFNMSSFDNFMTSIEIGWNNFQMILIDVFNYIWDPINELGIVLGILWDQLTSLFDGVGEGIDVFYLWGAAMKLMYAPIVYLIKGITMLIAVLSGFAALSKVYIKAISEPFQKLAEQFANIDLSKGLKAFANFDLSGITKSFDGIGAKAAKAYSESYEKVMGAADEKQKQVDKAKAEQQKADAKQQAKEEAKVKADANKKLNAEELKAAQKAQDKYDKARIQAYKNTNDTIENEAAKTQQVLFQQLADGIITEEEYNTKIQQLNIDTTTKLIDNKQLLVDDNKLSNDKIKEYQLQLDSDTVASDNAKTQQQLDNQAKVKAAALQTFVDEQTETSVDYSAQATALKQSYADGLIDKEQYLNDLADLDDQYLQHQINNIEKAIKAGALGDEEKKKALAQLQKLKDQQLDNDIARNEKDVEDTKEAAIAKAEARAEAMQTVQNFANALFELNAALTEARISDLEKERAYELSLAGDTAEEKDAINQKYNAKVAAEKTKQAKADKAQAAFNIVINTAVAAMMAYAQLGPVAGTVAAILIAALGAVELAAVLAKPIPKFKDGTDNFSGGLATVGDGKKEELITLPDGTQYMSPATDTIVNLPRGTQILSGDDTAKLYDTGLMPSIASNHTVVSNNSDKPSDDILRRIEGHLSKGERVDVLIDQNGIKTIYNEAGNSQSRIDKFFN